MSSQKGMRLVIDASLATSCGERGERGKMCQDFLICMLEETSFEVVITKEIGIEWDHHSHQIAREWRKSMNARRRVSRPKVEADEILRKKIRQSTSATKTLSEMEHDYHLIEAARTTDKRVVALDDKARGYFTSASNFVGELREIVWVNPTKAEEDAIIWLRSGIPAEVARQLRLSI